MGLDFVRNKQFRKTWNRSKNVLAERDLYSSTPTWLRRRVNAHRVAGSTLTEGEQLLASLDDDNHVVVSRGVSTVAVIASPPTGVVDVLRNSSSGGIAYATVESVRDISNTVSLSLDIPPKASEQ